jgi:hypothetical protein
MTDAIRLFIAGMFAAFALSSLVLAFLNLSYSGLPGSLFLYRKRHKKYHYFVSYRIFNNGIEETGGYRIVQSRQSPSEIDDAFFTATGKAMGVQLPLEIQFTGCSRLA